MSSARPTASPPPVRIAPALISALVVLTAAKFAINIALRWIPPFLPAIGRGVGADLATMTTLVGLGELCGLAGVAAGRMVHRHGERRTVIAGTATVALGAAVAGSGHLVAFTAGYALVVVGGAFYLTGGHTWIGERVPYVVRARYMGAYETSWAAALLVGAPLAGLSITALGWRAPFVGTAVLTAAAAVALALRLPGGGHGGGGRARPAGRLGPLAVGRIATGAALAFASMTVFVVSGAWLERAHGLSTGTIGLVTIALALVELAASVTVATAVDRWGKERAVRSGIVVMAAGVALVLSGPSLPVAVLALALFLGGFELAFVSTLTLITEANVAARGRALGINGAATTIARAAAALCGGWVFARFGMGPVVAVAAAGAAAGWAALSWSAGRDSRGRVTTTA